MRFVHVFVTAVMILTAGYAWPIGSYESFRDIVNDPATQTRRGITWDNDAFYFHGRATDQFYTNGFQYEWQYRGQGYYLKEQSGNLVRANSGQLASWLSGNEPRPSLYQQFYGFHFGQNIYTPTDLKLAPWMQDPNDRPYAAWFYIGLYREIISDSSAWLKYGIDLGLVGPGAMGELVQKDVHEIKLWHAAQPKGWSSQIRHEWGAVVFFEAAPVVVNFWQWNGYEAEFSPDIRVNLGNIFLNGQLSANIRLGKFNPIFKDPAGRARSHEAYFFVRLTGQGVGHDETIEGHGTVWTPKVHEEPFVYEAEAGFAYHFRRKFLSYSVVTRSSEVKEQSSKFPQHRFGRFIYTWGW